ncbi:FkbM family methyltransferase [Sporanaerobium hydrogeniformans]|uniref:FkbM family methyltransferase n=1 Tax=Sporanaerobium hydrogeniformans TaxID=3072179 RepID=A0AC61DEN9_9FIRM|nr:FkbM family methyltransferase [Sporanaerobium hydrogeniformans]PHV71352.1 FkbM family methyltransferase [Sporanaerobium hydrogeniformans]
MNNIYDLEKMLDDFENNLLDKNMDKVVELDKKSILLYGAGNIGKKLYRKLKEGTFNIVGFIDKNKEIDKSIYEVNVYLPEAVELEEYKSKAVVILAGLFSLSVTKDIKNRLYELGFKNVYGLNEINCSTIRNKAFYEEIFNDPYNKEDILNRDRDKVIQAFKLLEEEQDRKLYIGYIESRLKADFSNLELPQDICKQYLADDISIKKDYSRFIDCGGFDGDTIRNLINSNIDIQSIAVFEPQNDLCRKIADYIKITPSIEFATVFPCGVHSEFAKLKFNTCAEATSSARVDTHGDDIIQCVAIDDVLKGFKPSFIKMDIEGAEVDAIKGCKNTIIENHPQLAICVYHSISHIWEIPLLISSYYSGYKFYLRSYNFMGFETVLYAFPTE